MRIIELYQNGGVKNVFRGIRDFAVFRTCDIIRKTHSIIRTVLTPIYKILDKYKLVNPDQIYSDNYFKKRQNIKTLRLAYNFSKAIDQEFEPNSVIDFGCAIGHYLHYFYKKDKDVLGIDGAKNAKEYAIIPKNNIMIYDLRNMYYTKKRYDVAICFETAEHISNKFADNLITSLVLSSDIIIFSAAIPKQMGTYHVNEQPKNYWIKKFEKHNYVYDEIATKSIKERVKYDDVRKENLLIFKRK